MDLAWCFADASPLGDARNVDRNHNTTKECEGNYFLTTMRGESYILKEISRRIREGWILSPR